MELEDYQVELSAVSALKLTIDPEFARGRAAATLLNGEWLEHWVARLPIVRERYANVGLLCVPSLCIRKGLSSQTNQPTLLPKLSRYTFKTVKNYVRTYLEVKLKWRDFHAAR